MERTYGLEYRGERVKLSSAYADYDDYKNNPENIHPSERARVQHLVKTAAVASSYADQMGL